VVGCFGLAGYLKVQLSTHSAERLRKLAMVQLGSEASRTAGHRVEDVVIRPRSVCVKLSGINDRTSAEQCQGAFLFVAEEDLEAPEEGSFFVHDIIGCTVHATDGRALGTVEDVYKLPAQDVWAVRSEGKLMMVPAVKEFIAKVDTRKRIIIIRLIDGLTEE
jgi:16S rRNA processing protein RimM